VDSVIRDAVLGSHFDSSTNIEWLSDILLYSSIVAVI
jgi:hypothetical protein